MTYDIDRYAVKKFFDVSKNIKISKTYHISESSNMIYDIAILDLSRRIREIANFFK